MLFETLKNLLNINSLNESRTSFKDYGAWLSPEGKLFSVKGYQQHGKIGKEIARKLKIEELYDYPALGISHRLVEDYGYVRIIFGKNEITFNANKINRRQKRIIYKLAKDFTGEWITYEFQNNFGYTASVKEFMSAVNKLMV